MAFDVEVLSTQSYADEAAARIALSLPGTGAVVLTGGTTAQRIYPPLAGTDAGWGDLDIFFSDERCVPPDSEDSNFAMADKLLLSRVDTRGVHRMKGEHEPAKAASDYHDEASEAAGRGFDLVLLGMGADCHIAAMFPGSPALGEDDRLCVPVERPDGLEGLTLTPPALLSARHILLLVEGDKKAEALRRAVSGDEAPETCPASLLGDHPDATFLVDEAAASRL